MNDRDQVFVIKVRANDISWEEAQRLTPALEKAAMIAVREVASFHLERRVDVEAPHVVHRYSHRPRGFFRTGE